MPTTRTDVFDRLIVDYLVRGGARVSWSLYGHCVDPPPWSFQLQVGETGVADADDWTDVGPPVTDAFYAIDPLPRARGASVPVHYRVVLTTANDTYTSPPASSHGLLNKHDWILAHEIDRKEELRHRVLASPAGWLLKRRHHGLPQPAADAQHAARMVLDPLTGDVVRRQGDSQTLGTGILGGFYRALPIRVDLVPGGRNPDVDARARGNIDDDSTRRQARMSLLPEVARRDVVVIDGSDLRYEVGRITTLAQIRGVPVVGMVELCLLPLADVAYNVDVEAMTYVDGDTVIDLTPPPTWTGPWM